MTPKLIHTITELRDVHDQARGKGGTVGLVPTMGYLHQGHTSLMDAARDACDLVTTTIFINPLQFAPTEDLASYPRDLEGDLAVAGAAGVDIVFAPSGTEMYPRGRVLTEVAVPELARLWEGASRPGHFGGVATVVAKLFAIAGPCRAYFGEKDYQQLQVVRQMAFDLSLPVDVVGCPIIREPDGLALSSRNVYLEPAQRSAAVVLKAALDMAVSAVQKGERSGATVQQILATVVGGEPLATLDYGVAVDAATLEPLEHLNGDVRLLITAKVGRPRLLDNCGITIP